MPAFAQSLGLSDTQTQVRFWRKPTPAGKSGMKKLRRLMKDETVDLWTLDEVHFQQQESRCRMWIPPEVKDPVVFHHPTRKSVATLEPFACGTVDSCSTAR